MDLQVRGLDDIHKSLKALGGKEAKRARTNASRTAARVLAKAVKANAPVGTGELKKSVRASKPFNGRTVTVAPVKVAYWGQILEGGVDSKRNITLKHKGWISDAAMGAAQSAIDKFTADMWKQIANQWERWVKRGKR